MTSTASELEAQMEELQRRKKYLVRKAKVVQQTLRRTSQKAHIAHLLEEGGASEVCPKVEQGVAKELLLLLEFTSFCNDTVVSYVLGQGRAEHYGSHGLVVLDSDTRRNIATGVDLLYMGVSYSLVLGLQEAGDRKMYDLCKYVTEYRLFHWLLKQNCEKGVYPRARQVFAKACSFLPASAPLHLQQKMKAFFLAGDRAARFWLFSFKQRWGVKLGLPPAGEDLEPGQLECKVPSVQLTFTFN